MATRIPLPGNMIDTLMQGVKTGTNQYTSVMNPILQREKQAQAEKHFQEQLKLQKAAAGRAAQKMDPMYEINQFKALQDFITGGGQIGGQQGATMPAIQQPQPTQEMGQGMGMFTPEGLNEAQQAPIAPPSPQQQGGMNLDLLKQNPMLRGFFKHKFGFDPLAEAPQTQEQKDAAALNLFKQKEDYKKSGQAGVVPLTTAMKTKLQGVVTGVDNSLPVIQELVSDFQNLPTGSEFLNPALYAAYNAKANSIIEPLINAFGLNVTDATKQMMHDQVFRKTNEPLPKYRNRLVDLAKEIIRRRNDSFNSLQGGAINPKSQFTDEFFEGLKSETREINGKKYRKIDGEWHEIA